MSIHERNRQQRNSYGLWARKENVRHEAFPFLKVINKTLEQLYINVPAS